MPNSKTRQHKPINKVKRRRKNNNKTIIKKSFTSFNIIKPRGVIVTNKLILLHQAKRIINNYMYGWISEDVLLIPFPSMQASSTWIE
jgi:hypothetical protein